MTVPGGVRAVLVDARPVNHPTARQRGIGRYVAGLLGGLHSIGAPVVALYGSDVEAETLRDAIPDLPLARWSPSVIAEHASDGVWYVATQLMLHPIPLDPIPAIVSRAGLPVAGVMYDVIPYRFPDTYLREPNARLQARLRAPLVRTVDALLAISRFAASTAAAELDYPASRIATIGAGVDAQFAPRSTRPLPRADRVLPTTIGRYVVAVTGGDERKNTEGLLRAWALLPESLRARHHLVIATAHAPAVLSRWQGWAAEFGVTDDVVFTGSVTDDEMVSILQGAALAVLPSTEEGFGLPVLEAAACAVPVICSNVSSLPEVLEEPRAEFDPFDPASIAHAIGAALVDDDLRSVLLAAGRRAADRWTWQRVASDTVTALDELGPRWHHTIRRPPARIAVAGPLAESWSGIGRYDSAVLDALRHRPTPHVDVFADASADPSPSPSGTLPVRALGRVAKTWNYDHVVAVLGSSPHHVATVELATAQPCHVWLHESSLVGAYVGLAHLSGSERWGRDLVATVIEASEPAARAAAALDGDVLDAPRLDALGVTMLGPVLERARSVIVSSDAAADAVRAVRPHGPAVAVIPLAYPAVAPAPACPARSVIVAAGWLAENKAPLVALDVLVRLRREHDVDLHFVGPIADAELASEITSAAAAGGVADFVELTGHVDDATYRARLGTARVGLQLRTAGRGEMSAAIADLVSLGVPTVTTMATAGPSSSGLQVVDLDVDSIVEAVAGLLADDDAWRAASRDALDRAGAWTFDDVASAVLDWLDRAETLDPATVHRYGHQ